MANNQSVVTQAEQLAKGNWANDCRQRGGVVTVLGSNGHYYYYDSEFLQLLKRTSIPPNGFDMIPAQHAAAGAALMQANGTEPARTWFPFESDSRGLVWCRIEGKWFGGLLVSALWREDDVAKHQILGEPL